MFFLTVLQLKHIFLSLKRSFDKNKQQLKTNNLHEANDPPLLVTSLQRLMLECIHRLRLLNLKLRTSHQKKKTSVKSKTKF